MLNPCDYSRISDGSAQEATLLAQGDNVSGVRSQSIVCEVPTRPPNGSVYHELAGEERVDAKKNKVFSNMFIGKKSGKSRSKAH